MDPNPYEPPHHDDAEPYRPRVVTPPAPGLLPYYSPAKQAGMATLIALAVSLGAQWVIHVIDLCLYDDLAAGRLRGLASAIAVENALGTLSTLARLLGSVLFLVWFYGASRNTRALERIGMSVSPGWAVGWFFIPFASLYVPYRTMSELEGCSNPRGVGITPTSVPAWWGLFLLGNVLRLVRGALARADLETRVTLGMASTAALTGAGVALWILITSINRGQDRIAAELWGKPEPRPRRRRKKKARPVDGSLDPAG